MRNNKIWIVGIGAIASIMIGFAHADTVWGEKDRGQVAYIIIKNPPCKPACHPPLITEFRIELRERR